jgi:DNA-binding NtrC family response regulator
VLIDHFVKGVCATNGWKSKTFAPEAVAALEAYAWPGNVRELRKTVERLLLLADGEVDESLVREVLPQSSTTSLRGSPAPAGYGTLSDRMDAFEKETIRAELERAQHNMTEAARSLGLERSHLYKKCSQLGIRIKDLRHS